MGRVGNLCGTGATSHDLIGARCLVLFVGLAGKSYQKMWPELSYGPMKVERVGHEALAAV